MATYLNTCQSCGDDFVTSMRNTGRCGNCLLAHFGIEGGQ